MSDPEFLNKTLSLGLDSLLSKNRHKEYLEVMEKDLKLNIDLLSDCINNKGFSIELCSNVDDNIPVFGGIPLPFVD